MNLNPEIYSDDYRLCWKLPRNSGPPVIKVLFDRRCGFQWPTVENPGYFCILGLLDEPTMDGRVPRILLAEAESVVQDQFFEQMLAQCKKWGCKRLFGDLSNRWAAHEAALYAFGRKRGVRGLEVQNAVEFGDFEQARPVIRKYAKKHEDEKQGALRCNSIAFKFADTIQQKQLSTMTPADFQGHPEQRFYAVAALNYVLMSWEMFPWIKPSRDEPFTGDGEGYR